MRELKIFRLSLCPVVARLLPGFLSVVCLQIDFVFEGFLPSKTVARQRVLETLNSETRTMVFYEAPHRITETIAAMGKAFGQERRVMIAREITKHYETFWQGSLAEATSALEKNEITQRGEFVVILDGIGEKPEFYDEAALMRTLFA